MNIKKCDIINIKNSRVILFSLTIFVSFFFSGCWSSKSSNKTSEPKLIVINVLDKSNFEDCHITGSINIPFEAIEDEMKILDKKDSYVLYCSNYACTAAPFAANLMKEAGFEHAAFFPGGIVDWYQKGYPCTGPSKMDYLKEENEPFDEDDHLDTLVVSIEDLKSQMVAAKMI
ncbi:MAG: rhodanese-like domain-containing protein [Candidatus Dependentiae bacterium]|nr:rhodanese-like domain-containing protein [Candidatus Dependentiae bacterium]